jgi:hypothetical protein
VHRDNARIKLVTRTIAGKFVIVRWTTSAAISNTVQYIHCTVLQIGRHTWEYHRAAISNTVQYIHCSTVLQIRSCMFADNRTWDYQCCYQQYSTVRTLYCTSNWTSCMIADNRTSYIVQQPRKKRNEKKL